MAGENTGCSGGELMLKRLVLICLLCAAPAWASTAYQRPTANADRASGLGCYSGAYVASSDMSAVYNGKSGAGPTGTVNAVSATYSSGQTFEQRVFSSFQALTGTPSALTLSASVQYVIVGSSSGAASCVYYSTNGGSTWTTMGTVTGVQATLTVTITGATMSQVQVIAIAVSATAATERYINIYDIWTTETITTGYIMPRFIRSVFHKQRHKTKRILLARGANVVGPAGQ